MEDWEAYRAKRLAKLEKKKAIMHRARETNETKFKVGERGGNEKEQKALYLFINLNPIFLPYLPSIPFGFTLHPDPGPNLLYLDVPRRRALRGGKRNDMDGKGENGEEKRKEGESWGRGVGGGDRDTHGPDVPDPKSHKFSKSPLLPARSDPI